jgi:hypothetical protein
MDDSSDDNVGLSLPGRRTAFAAAPDMDSAMRSTGNSRAISWLAGGDFIRCLVEAAAVLGKGPGIMTIARAVSFALSKPAFREVVPDEVTREFETCFPKDVLNAFNTDFSGLLLAEARAHVQISEDMRSGIFEEELMAIFSEDDMHKLCLDLKLQDAVERASSESEEPPPDYSPSVRRRRSLRRRTIRRSVG